MKLDQDHILNNLTLTISEFIESVNAIQPTSLSTYSKENTLIVMIDMINGFCTEGPLSSPFINAIVPDISKFIDQAISQNIPIISYRDAHPKDAAEFRDFPSHCVVGTSESELVSSLQRNQLIDITKNSTNGFLSKNPLDFLDNCGKHIQHIIVIGCVTDICVRDFATTINKYLQEINQSCIVHIIENLVDTYHIEEIHDRQVEHTLALYQMKNTGINIIKLNP